MLSVTSEGNGCHLKRRTKKTVVNYDFLFKKRGKKISFKCFFISELWRRLQGFGKSQASCFTLFQEG